MTKDKKPKVRLIGLGHPRSGTGYFSKLAKAHGLDVGHEKLGKDGISSWLWVPKEEEVPWGPGYVPPKEGVVDLPIYILRNPKDLIASVYYTETVSIEWRATTIMKILGGLSGATLDAFLYDGPHGAASSCIKWATIASKLWTGLQFVRIDELPLFFETLTGKKIKKTVSPSNKRNHPTIDHRISQLKDNGRGLSAWEHLNALYENKKGNARQAALLHHYLTNPDHNTFVNEKVLSRLFREARIEIKGKVKDAGCGKGAAGPILRKLGFDEVVGVDYCSVRADMARETGAYDWVSCEDFSLNRYFGYPDDVVLCCEVLEHLENPRRVVENVTQFCPIVGSVPINHKYKAHLQVFESDKDVEEKLGVKVLFNDGKRAWFVGRKK